MTIIFYSMGKKCGFCVKAEKLLENEINNGSIVVKPASASNGKFRGYPSFENPSNGLTHSGLPPSVDYLYNKLKKDEGTHEVKRGTNYGKNHRGKKHRGTNDGKNVGKKHKNNPVKEYFDTKTILLLSIIFILIVIIIFREKKYI